MLTRDSQISIVHLELEKFSVDLTTLISCLNSQVSSEICVCRLEKLSSIRDSMAISLSRSISIEISESVSWFPSISSLFCLFRFGVGLSAELELDERSETTIVLITRYIGAKKTSLVASE